MNYIEIEKEFRKITGDYTIKISEENFYYTISNVFEYIFNTITNLNGLILREKQIKEERFSVFKDMKDFTDFERCIDNSISLLSERRNELRGHLFQLIGVFKNNPELMELFEDELPCMQIILEKSKDTDVFFSMLDSLLTILYTTENFELMGISPFEYLDGLFYNINSNEFEEIEDN